MGEYSEQRFSRWNKPPWTQHILHAETPRTYVAKCGIRLRKVNAKIIDRSSWSIKDHACYGCHRAGVIW